MRVLQSLRLAVVLSTAVLAAACGGGGGGDTGSGTSSVPDVPLSGLMPSAPTAGAVLYADAAIFRPMKDQYRWTYQGLVKWVGMNAPETPYTNLVTQRGAGAGVQEQASNPFGMGPVSTEGLEPLVIEAGVVRQRLRASLLPGVSTDLLDFVELRSPVRQGEQYNVYDRRLTDIGRDLDGDKRNDGFDVAIWVRVEGEEVLDLPDRSQVKTLKTILTMQLRPVYSTGKVANVDEVKQTTWYLPNVGIVKRQIDMPAENQVGIRKNIVEELRYWDGIDRGYGVAQPADLVMPSGSKPLGAVLGVVGFESHAVMASEVNGELPSYGITLTHIDAVGKAVASRTYTSAELFGPNATAFGYEAARLVRVGDELRIVAFGDGIVMRRLSSTGQQVLGASPVQLVKYVNDANETSPDWSIERQKFSFASTSDQIWLSWNATLRLPGSNYKQVIRLRGFDGAGNPITSVQDVSPATVADLSGGRLVIQGNRLLVSWGIIGYSPAWFYSVYDTANGRALAQHELAGLKSGTWRIPPQALSLEAGLGLWTANEAGGVAVVRLNEVTYSLEQSTASYLDGQTLSTVGLGLKNLSSGMVLGGNPLLYVAYGENVNIRGQSEWFVSRAPAGVNQPAATPMQLLGRGVTKDSYPRYLMPMGNKVLVIGARPWGQLCSYLVWL